MSQVMAYAAVAALTLIIAIIAVIFMYAAFFIIINTAAAIKAVPSTLVEMGRSYCANDRQLFFEIRLRLLQQLAEGLCDLSVALDVNRPAANGGFRRGARKTQ